MAAKSLAAQAVRLIVPAGKASPSPPVGPALGARGVKSMDFCKEFNARTQHLEPDTPTPVIITIQPDRTFKFDIHTPPTSWLIKQAAGMEKGTTSPPAGMRVSEAQAAGTISLKHVYEIARVKAKDNRMKLVSLESIAKSVIGTCKSMGVRVIA